MSPTESMSILPRESAVTAALAGAVVVVLAYASGFGLHTPMMAAPVNPVPSIPTLAAAPDLPVPVAPPIVVTIPLPTLAPTPTAAPTPTVAPIRAPKPAATTPPVTPSPTGCSPGVVGGLLAPVASLVDGLLGADLLGADLLGPSANVVDCTIVALSGSTCCESSTAARKAVR
ncbi:MAG: hypothetical protein ACJ716_12425 [Marmoricola sp.]